MASCPLLLISSQGYTGNTVYGSLITKPTDVIRCHREGPGSMRQEAVGLSTFVRKTRQEE